MADQTIDMTALSAAHTSSASATAMKARYRAEWRLKMYGILAIALAAGALAILIYTVLGKAVSVMHEYYLTLDTQIVVSDAEMKRIDDPNPRLIPALNKVVRNAIIDATGTSVGRRQRRDLTGLLSSDAGLDLGRLAKNDQTLIGGAYNYKALLNDQVQLYFMGDLGRLQDAGTVGSLTLEGDVAGEVSLTLSPDALQAALFQLQQTREREAKTADRIAANQDRAVRETRLALDAALTDERRAELQAQLDVFIAQRDQAMARAQEAHRKGEAGSDTFVLRETDPSVLVRVKRGWIKISEIAPGLAKGQVLLPLQTTGPIADGDWKTFVLKRSEAGRKLNDQQIVWLESFRQQGRIEKRLNTRVLLQSDSSNAELAGIWGALVGSFWTMIVTFSLAFPIGVMASIYLEEFAPKNKLTDFIEVNINNLAAVPSIVFGLLGVTILISGVKLFGMDLFDGLLKSVTEDPRSTPLAGGVVLALMSLPTIIIASRASIRAVPPSIRDAAFGLGASRLQTSTHHVLPLAMPGILTGSIIAMAQALGETAPLIIVGMNAFIQDPPGDPLDKANVLPSLIYLWNNQSERLFDGKTAVAITVLLLFLILMNALAVLLRKRFERRW